MRPWAVASLLLSWLAFAAQAQTKGAELTERDSSATSAVAPTVGLAALLAGWALLACDSPQRTAVLRRPDGELVLVRAGDPLPQASLLGIEPPPTEPIPQATVRQVLGDRLMVDLPAPADGGPDAAWIHVAAADGTSRVQYLRHRHLPPDLHEHPLTRSNSAQGAPRSSAKRPE